MGIIHGDENLAFKYPFFFNYFKRKFAEKHTGSVEFSRFYEPPKDNFFWKSSSKYLCDVTTASISVNSFLFSFTDLFKNSIVFINFIHLD